MPIALGTDAGVVPHGTNGHEFFLMVDWGGMTPMQAIVAGTMNAAKLLGWDDRSARWRRASSPTSWPCRATRSKDIHAMESPVFVMKNGVVYKGRGGGLAVMDSLSTIPAPPPIARQPLAIGGVPIPSRFFLAPLAGYTSLAYRLAVRENGGLGLATTDLVNARAILERRPRSAELSQTCPEDRPIAIQLYGHVIAEMQRGRPPDGGQRGDDHRHQHGLPRPQGREDRAAARP